MQTRMWCGQDRATVSVESSTSSEAVSVRIELTTVGDNRNESDQISRPLIFFMFGSCRKNLAVAPAQKCLARLRMLQSPGSIPVPGSYYAYITVCVRCF